MYLKELMDLAVVVKLSVTLLKMLYPVDTRVLDLRRKTLFYSSLLYVGYKCTGCLLSANSLLE
jgi:hypothetical protein